MPISHSDVKAYIQTRSNNVRYMLEKLNAMFMKGRDDCEMPIYSTKYRIKSCDGIYFQ